MLWILTSRLNHITVEKPRKSELDGPLDGLIQRFGFTHVETEALRGACSVGARFAVPATVCSRAVAPRVSRPQERCSSASTRHFQIREVRRVWLPSLGRGQTQEGMDRGCQAASAREGAYRARLSISCIHPPSIWSMPPCALAQLLEHDPPLLWLPYQASSDQDHPRSS